jgi:hypothetical protein
VLYLVDIIIQVHVHETRVEADALSDQAICCSVLKGQSRVKRVGKLRWMWWAIQNLIEVLTSGSVQELKHGKGPLEVVTVVGPGPIVWPREGVFAVVSKGM